MDKTFLDQQKAILQQELEEMLKELDLVSSPDVGDHVPGERAPKFPNYGDDNYGENSESPAEVSDYTVNVNITCQLESASNEIKNALKAIDDGTYGTCSACGGTISEERLAANATATTCMACAQSHTT